VARKLLLSSLTRLVRSGPWKTWPVADYGRANGEASYAIAPASANSRVSAWFNIAAA
jgi:hypothetical protein